MPIKCQECGKEFAKLITSTHLKQHEMTTAQYRERHGSDSLASPEYRAERSAANSGENNPNYGNKWSDEQKHALSEKAQGREPWNKGLKLADTTVQRQAAQRREARYRRGEIQRGTVEWSRADRKRISQQIKAYARANPDKVHQRAVKAAQTRKKRGIPGSFTGKRHTPEARAKISAASKRANATKSQQAQQRIMTRIAESDLSIVGDYQWHLELKCNHCQTQFPLTAQYFHNCRYHDKICPTCHPRGVTRSQDEQELYEFVKSICSDAVPNNRSVLKGRGEIDIWVPSKNIAIEFNGLYWHSESALTAAGYPATRDCDKMEALIQAGVKPIIVYEDEWHHRRDIVQSRLRNALGCASVKSVYARNTEVREIASKEARKFCDQYHLQGAARSNHRLGLFAPDNELVAVMTFSKSNLSRKIHTWEINRFCTLTDIRVVGGASKLFNHFLSSENPSEVVSYGDRRWGNGGLYEELGFRSEGVTRPGYWYFLPNHTQRIHRYRLRKNSQDDPNKTEYENRLAQGYLRIWDCGHSRWKWTQEKAR